MIDEIVAILNFSSDKCLDAIVSLACMVGELISSDNAIDKCRMSPGLKSMRFSLSMAMSGMPPTGVVTTGK